MYNMSYRLLVGLSLLLVVPGVLFGQGREVCFESLPKVGIGAEVKSIVEDVLVLTSFTPSFPDGPCSSQSYRFESIEIKASSSKAVIAFCYLSPGAQKNNLCKFRTEVSLPADAAARKTAITRKVEDIFNKHLYAHPQTPLGYYSVLSCDASLRFRLQLERNAVKPSTFEPCYYRLAFLKLSAGIHWFYGTQYYVNSSTQPSIEIFVGKPFAVNVKAWEDSPDDPAEIVQSCTAGQRYLVPYLRPFTANPGPLWRRGSSAGEAVDSGSPPPGSPKQ